MTHRWTPEPDSHCRDCGIAHPWEQALKSGAVFDPEDLPALVPIPPCEPAPSPWGDWHDE